MIALNAILMQFILVGQAIAGTNSVCRPENPSDPKLYSSHFHWNYTLEEMMDVFKVTYTRSERLPKRLYFDEGQKQYFLPYGDSEKSFVKVPSSFITNLISQVQSAFANKVIDALMFPDMGHSHFLIPEKSWKNTYSKFSVKENNKLYEKLFSDPQVKVLYHTAEQLRMRDENGQLNSDPRVQKRYRERNLVFNNDSSGRYQLLQNPSSPANTVGEVAGYYWWGAGFNISANKDACLSAKLGDQNLSFDISLYDLEPDPNSEQAASSD